VATDRRWHDQRRDPRLHPPDPRRGPRGDPGVGRLVRRPCRPERPGSGPLPVGPPHGTCRRAERGQLPAHLDSVRQHDRHHRPAVVPRRRAHRAAHPGVHPMERSRNGDQRQQDGRRNRRAPLHVRLVRLALRGGVQLVLQGQGRRSTRRPRLLPGPCGPRCLRTGVPRAPAGRTPPRRVPYGDRRRRPVELPAPPPHARLLGVPHGVDGPGPHQLHLPRPLQPVPGTPPRRRHRRVACVLLRG